MTQNHLATAADYADSLITAKRTKVVLFVLVLFTLIAQLVLFFVVRYGYPGLLEAPITKGDQTKTELLQYLIGLLDFSGMILPAALTITLFVILQVQLVGRLLGTSKVMSAVLWSVVLCLLLFPWQAVLNNPAINYNPGDNAIGLKIPGVLYTWAEFSKGRKCATFVVGSDVMANLLNWARYAAFPLLAVLILIWIQFKSDSGIGQSLGRDVIVPETTPVE